MLYCILLSYDKLKIYFSMHDIVTLNADQCWVSSEIMHKLCEKIIPLSPAK